MDAALLTVTSKLLERVSPTNNACLFVWFTVRTGTTTRNVTLIALQRTLCVFRTYIVRALEYSNVIKSLKSYLKQSKKKSQPQVNEDQYYY